MADVSRSVQKVLGLSFEETSIVLKQAKRLENKYIPDGRLEYVPITEEYASKDICMRPNRLKKLLGGEVK